MRRTGDVKHIGVVAQEPAGQGAGNCEATDPSGRDACTVKSYRAQVVRYTNDLQGHADHRITHLFDQPVLGQAAELHTAPGSCCSQPTAAET